MAIINDGVTIDKGLEASVMRHKMESKDTLATKGALYVGTGTKKDSFTVTKSIAPNGASDNGKVLVADASEGVGWKVDKITADNLEGGRVAQATNADQATKADTVSYDGNYKSFIDAFVSACLLKIYPVGSIYMSIKDVDPSTFLGGTWERWGQGRVPVGVDVDASDPPDTDFATAGKEGGEKQHTLTKDEMPVHAHNAYIRFRGLYVSKLDSTTPTDTGGTYVGGGKATDPGDSSFLDFGSYINDTETAGKGKPHNNLQPYITCYMWKRTA